MRTAGKRIGDSEKYYKYEVLAPIRLSAKTDNVAIGREIKGYMIEIAKLFKL